jgi:hypothetical protein
MKALPLIAAMAALALTPACSGGSKEQSSSEAKPADTAQADTTAETGFEAGFKKSARESYIRSCIAEASKQAPAGMEAEVKSLCECSAGKMMDGKSVKEIMSASTDVQGQVAKAQECMKELFPQMSGGKSG